MRNPKKLITMLLAITPLFTVAPQGLIKELAEDATSLSRTVQEQQETINALLNTMGKPGTGTQISLKEFKKFPSFQKAIDVIQKIENPKFTKARINNLNDFIYKISKNLLIYQFQFMQVTIGMQGPINKPTKDFQAIPAQDIEGQEIGDPKSIALDTDMRNQAKTLRIKLQKLEELRMKQTSISANIIYSALLTVGNQINTFRAWLKGKIQKGKQQAQHLGRISSPPSAFKRALTEKFQQRQGSSVQKAQEILKRKLEEERKRKQRKEELVN
ncbi:hypothetical protein KAU11_01850 [Candidatus Babeliales bacterium]|nr:hypothetical protein [Candidatus Babeliales bacterium]